MIKINKIEPETVDVHHEELGFIGTVNEYEFTDLRIQIMKAKAKGYYVLKDGVKHPIDILGRLREWKFFNLHEEQLRQLLEM